MTIAEAHAQPSAKHRMEALADGVFAIVMTLLVLEIKVPDLPRSAANHDIWVAVRSEAPVFFSFLITFILSGAFWHLHQRLLTQLKAVRGGLLVLNIAFLMFVSLLPFSTGMLGHFLQRPFAQEFYFANQLVLGLLLVIQHRVARRLGLLNDPESEGAIDLSWRLLVFPIGAAFAMIICPLAPKFSFYGFVVAGLATRIARRRAKSKTVHK
jgi:uncharacterized membrane protein